MSDITVYTVYGLHLADNADVKLLAEDPGFCPNDGATVGLLMAGTAAQPAAFLVLNWTKVPPGEYVFHSGEGPNANKFARDRWNSDLRAEADRLGVEIIAGPGWFTIPSED